MINIIHRFAQFGKEATNFCLDVSNSGNNISPMLLSYGNLDSLEWINYEEVSLNYFFTTSSPRNLIC